jgi:hypothetical protein
MYEIHFRRSFNSKTDYTVIARNIDTLEEAEKLRVVSGDLVVWADTHEVVKDPAWLFDWERKDPNSYAMRAMRAANQGYRR